MIVTILTLLGGGLGALLRLAPEVLKLFNAKADRDHEYRMTQLQFDIDKARSSQAIDLVHAQGEMAEAVAQMAAYTEALKAQATPSGVRWIDGLNASVRPVITYWWMVLFTVYKSAIIWNDWTTTATFIEFATNIWTAEDAGILSMIIGFFFVNRSLLKKNR